MFIQYLCFPGNALRALFVGALLCLAVLLMPTASGAGIHQGIGYLVSVQNADGSWDSDPVLSVLTDK